MNFAVKIPDEGMENMLLNVKNELHEQLNTMTFNFREASFSK